MDLASLREPVSALSHGVGLLLALPGTLLLWQRSGGDPGKRLSLLVYGLSLMACYAASTLYHGVRLPPDQVVAFARLDGVGIFALIAGSYTPLAWCLLRGRGRWWILTAVWGVAALASLLIATGHRFSPVLSTGTYLGLGWVVVACYRELEQVVSRRAMVPIAIGGLCYSIGAVLNLFRWPALWTGVFGTHELFHLFVLAGSLAHYWFMLRVIVPFSREPGAGSRVPIASISEAAPGAWAVPGRTSRPA